MDPKLKMVKIGDQQKKIQKIENITSKPSRLILQKELENIVVENELIIIDREINSFKMQLELNNTQFATKINTKEINMCKKIVLNRGIQKTNIPQLALTNKSALEDSNICSKKQMKENAEFFKYLKSDCIVNNGQVEVESELYMKHVPTIKSTDMLPWEALTGNGIIEECILEDKCILQSEPNMECVYNERCLIYQVINKWRRYTLHKKIYKARSRMEDKRNKTLLKKYWNIWVHVITEKRRIIASVNEKNKTNEKIDRFLKILQEQKQSLVASQLTKYPEGKSKIKARNSNCLNQNSQTASINIRKKTTQNDGQFQSKSSPSQPSIQYQSRFETQQNIIAEQKSKLKKQSKIIEELQLQQLKFQTNKSTQQVCEDINRKFINCDLSLKPKLKQVQARLSDSSGRLESSEINYTVKSLRINPSILTRMEERALEREKRWKMIKERKIRRIEEKERLKKEEEEERKRKELNEKLQRIEELKERRRLEKEIEVQRQKEKEQMIRLRLKAIHYYRNKLLKRGIKGMLYLVTLRRQQNIMVENHYILKLLSNSFYAWRQNVHAVLNWKMKRAILLHNKQLKRKVFFGFLKVHREYVVKCQVAVDFYNMSLQEHIFITWHQFTCIAYMENIYKLGQASVHFNRILLKQYFNLWKKLPFAMRLEREKEKRKQVLRMKVQEMLPDYKPMFCIFDYDSFTY